MQAANPARILKTNASYRRGVSARCSGRVPVPGSLRTFVFGKRSAATQIVQGTPQHRLLPLRATQNDEEQKNASGTTDESQSNGGPSPSSSSPNSSTSTDSNSNSSTPNPSNAGNVANTATGSNSSNFSADNGSSSSRITSTLADLDALLGISEEEEKKKKQAEEEERSRQKTASASQADVSISPDARQRMAEADAQRLPPGSGSRDEVDLQFQRIIQRARGLADKEKQPGSREREEQELKREMDVLLQGLNKKSEVLSKDEIRQLKEAAFGPQTFWVTEIVPLNGLESAGLLVRGNLRDERSKVFALVCEKVSALFGDRLTVLMSVDAAAAANDAMSGTSLSGTAATLNQPRVAFQIVPSAQAQPPPTAGWGRALAFVLVLLLVASCGQLSLAANVTKLPKETLDWFSNPANLESGGTAPGLDTWDPTLYFMTAIPIFSALLGTNMAHEVAHRVMASVRNVKLGPTYFIPNLQIGAFGGVTPFISLLKNHAQLGDVASAGPLVGLATSASVLLIGLLQTQGADPGSADGMLIPIPTLFFQNSVLMGSTARLLLGEAALRGSQIAVSPLVIAGWCGMVSQAFQLLPVGSVDGGRMMQASFGAQALAISSFCTYLGLGLGLLGSSLALPYGLYVIICQRTAERYIQDTVSPAGEARSAMTVAAVLAAILVLLPMAPELADALGVGPQPFL